MDEQEKALNPGIQINCPMCGALTAYIRSEGDTHVYRCPRTVI